jgi:hypothetical protein
MKIEFFEDVYSKYSRLDFSPEYEDNRSVALEGLERRLISVYETRGRYGALHNDFLHRSLLWERDGPQALRRITFKAGKNVPSWSWMAVMGPIKYVDAPFNGVNWNKEIKSPFRTGPVMEDDVLTQHVGDLEAVAIDIMPDETTQLIFDREEEGRAIKNLKCVLVGSGKQDQQWGSKYFVLLVAPINSKQDCTDYERVGVAVMIYEEIDFAGRELKVRIV